MEDNQKNNTNMLDGFDDEDNQEINEMFLNQVEKNKENTNFNVNNSNMKFALSNIY